MTESMSCTGFFSCRATLCFLLALLAIVPMRAEESATAPTLSSSRKALQVREGFRAEPVATEPMVVDPISASLDYRGQLWVVEMPDYPTGPAEGDPYQGRIKILRDEDGDGIFDKATLFADRLPFATGVQPYRDGAFVTLEGAIVWMKDRDSDGVADTTTVLFEGFAEQNQQLRANHPTLGPDGLIYVAGGLRGGVIQAVDRRYAMRDEPINLRDRDFFFDPEGGDWGSVAGNSQFGVTIDDFGRRFGCSNRNPAKMTPLSLAAVERDPLLAPRDAIHDVALAAAESQVISRGVAWTTSNLHSGQFSAACGVFAPGAWDTSGEWLLACEPTAYLVQRQRIGLDGSVWKSRREPGDAEFLSSTQSWFRPVDITSGPGKSVYVVDMARAVIEHPDFMPSELKSRPDMTDGSHLGRIWRISPVDDMAVPRSLHSIDEAIRWLGADSPWQRQAATRFLLEGETPVGSRLSKVVRSKHASSAARARSAQVLHRNHRITGDDLRSLLAADEPRLRALAVRLSEAHSDLLVETLGHSSDASSLVLREVAALAGSQADSSEKRIAALAEIATSSTDHWVLRTVGSADSRLLPELASQIAETDTAPTELMSHLIARIAIDSADVAAMIVVKHCGAERTTALLDAAQINALEAWLDGVKRGKRRGEKALGELPAALRESMTVLVDAAAGTSENNALSPALRAKCLRLSADLGRPSEDLRRFMDDRESPEMRSVALPILLRMQPDWTRAYLSRELTGMTGQLRASAVQACCRSVDDTLWLMSQIENGKVPKTVIDPTTSNRLRKHPNESIRLMAGRILRSDPNRVAVLERYAAAAKSLGDASIGKKLFHEHCSACHQIDGRGTNVGPDISDSRTKTPEALLSSILDPNAAIDSSFIQYNVLTHDGRIIDGLLINETAEMLTLQQKGDKRVSISKEDIEAIKAPGTSLMPEGFEQTLSVKAMSDLLSYIKNWRYLDSSIPGNLGGTSASASSAAGN